MVFEFKMTFLETHYFKKIIKYFKTCFNNLFFFKNIISYYKSIFILQNFKNINAIKT